jgi:hypothetical protein
MAPATLFAIGVFTVVLLAIFVFVSVRGVTHPPAKPVPFDELLRADAGEATHPLRILLAIDGSPCSVAAVNDVAHCRLPKGSAVEVLTAIHSRVPVIPDPAFAFAAGRADDLHEQARRSPEIQQAAVTRLRPTGHTLTSRPRLLRATPRTRSCARRSNGMRTAWCWDRTGMAASVGPYSDRRPPPWRPRRPARC